MGNAKPSCIDILGRSFAEFFASAAFNRANRLTRLFVFSTLDVIGIDRPDKEIAADLVRRLL